MKFILGAFLGLIMGLMLSPVPTERVGLFQTEQKVRLYAPDGRHLLTGEVKSESYPLVTLCKISPVKMGGKFKSSQCVTVDSTKWLLIEAFQPDIVWK